MVRLKLVCPFQFQSFLIGFVISLMVYSEVSWKITVVVKRVCL